MFSLIKKDKQCKDCFWAEVYDTKNEERSLLECGYICHINPFKPVAMGLTGNHARRKELLKATK